MELFIFENKKISKIKQEFHHLFPYLKIEFYKTSHKEGEASPKKMVINPNQSIGEIKRGGTTGRIGVSGMMSVKEFEQKFHELFGVNVQVFRKSGSSWIQTSVSDNWTLTQQNNKAIESSRKTSVSNMQS
ncbi:MAG: hypothetical protein M3Q58_04520 [Bacteroidota bacterium]|nr:hypothetical protein [Bacteroidota bacterium]